MDVERISHRNLGRDDRIISDHGKEGRFPFLDEKVVDFLNGLAVNEKMDMRLGKGFGDKLLLRLLAYRLGLENASRQPKRAIQFGARTAKMESGKDKGNTSL
ncbi:Asparagine synthetase domain-containing protein 1 [Smittium mucronatum]|uniref:Asparagine synthetase domain-containing protein 1 n=1 Tax=Smittium mucronatum TaxID=133383 RepID=A0A1R0H4C0_9FUNG|nr:Asparagine synthetase domain-containing protein 1 [Smittium mucronatum]